MKILRKIALLTAAALLAASCCPCRSYQKRTRRPLAGTEWQLIQLGGRQMRPETGRFAFTLLEQEHRFTGVGACNQLTGTYRTDENRTLKIGPLVSTRMACPGMEDERAFVKALETATHYDMDGPLLLLLSNGELQAVFQAVPVDADKAAKSGSER